MRKKNVKVVLAGGLGNQLFQFFAGQYYASKTGSQLVVNAMLSQFGRTGHSDWIEAFTLVEGVKLEISKSRHAASYIWFMAVRRIRGLEQLVLGLLPGFHGLRARHFRSKGIGRDKDFEQVSRVREIVGYFQTSFYLDWLENHFGRSLTPSLRNPSPWFITQRKKLTEISVLSLHVRRGDYVREAPVFGLLSGAYYKKATESLAAAGHRWDQIWVYSDDIESAMIELRKHGLENLVPVVPPPGTHSAESMLLMGSGRYLVIANSTFSWWAARFADGAEIVAPEKWFRGLDDPLELGVPSWKTVEANWLELG